MDVAREVFVFLPPAARALNRGAVLGGSAADVSVFLDEFGDLLPEEEWLYLAGREARVRRIVAGHLFAPETVVDVLRDDRAESVRDAARARVKMLAWDPASGRDPGPFAAQETFTLLGARGRGGASAVARLILSRLDVFAQYLSTSTVVALVDTAGLDTVVRSGVLNGKPEWAAAVVTATLPMTDPSETAKVRETLRGCFTPQQIVEAAEYGDAMLRQWAAVMAEDPDVLRHLALTGDVAVAGLAARNPALPVAAVVEWLGRPEYARDPREALRWVEARGSVDDLVDEVLRQGAWKVAEMLLASPWQGREPIASPVQAGALLDLVAEEGDDAVDWSSIRSATARHLLRALERHPRVADSVMLHPAADAAVLVAGSRHADLPWRAWDRIPRELLPEVGVRALMTDDVWAKASVRDALVSVLGEVLCRLPVSVVEEQLRAAWAQELSLAEFAEHLGNATA